MANIVSSERLNFAKVKHTVDYPDFLDIQIQSFKDFFQLETSAEYKTKEGLYKVFAENFPITDSRENFVLEFIDYHIDPPKYSVDECIDRGLTYSVPLKAKLKLSCNDEDNEDFKTIEQEVFLGNIPYMTERGSFVINGAERVIVSQLHRSPGVFFAQSKHTNGTKLYSARIIPFKGSWIEFATDVSNVMYAYIDRKKKFPVTTLLRAIGFGSDKDILDLFGLSEEVPADKNTIKKVVGRRLAARVLKTWTEDFVDEDTGEVVSIDRNEIMLERDHVIKEEDLDIIIESGSKSIILHREDVNVIDFAIIYNTLQKDNSNSEKEAVEQIYRQLRNAEAPDEATAREIIQNLFFSDKRYDLGEVGRYRVNKKLGLNIGMDVRVLTTEDIVSIVKYLIGLINSRAVVDDIDHLSNRRVRTVGEQLYSQFGVGLSRMARTIKERMNVRDNEDFKPVDLINARTLSSVINSFFGTNQLSQFMDQTNPLAEITHKRRISALGPGGLSRERAGFEVRDVHYTHYGRLCTIETPEGPNIGLISSLCVHAKINSMGFIETPYRRVDGGKVVVNETIKYLSAEEEDGHYIATASSEIKADGSFDLNKIKARYEGDFPVVEPEKLTLLDVAPNQIVSVAASLIPFLEHNDANRALMGSNMQRQGVPLLRAEAPFVGTGIEGRIAKDSRTLITAEGDGVIDYVDARKIVVKYDLTEDQMFVSFDNEYKTYNLIKFRRTNQDTCINLTPIVKRGERVTKGQILVEGYATNNGELALGRNLQVAFMPWQGYNFEDAIVISERVVRDDIYTSIHIEEFELEVRDTKRGEEELTSEIPNVSEEMVRNLDENGIIRVGADVKEGDILIGKITPKGESDPTPEEKLLRAIFGDKAGDVKDASLKANPSLKGVVIDTKLFARARKDKDLKGKSKKQLDALREKYSADLLAIRSIMIDKMVSVLDGKTCQGIKHKFGDEILSKGVKFNRKNITENLFPEKNVYRDESNYNVPEEVNLIADLILENATTDEKLNKMLIELVKNYYIKRNEISGKFKRERFAIEVGDELPTGIVKLAKVYIAKKRKLKVGDKMAGRHGNKGVVAKIVRDEDMPFLEDGTPVDIVLNPLGVPSRMNIGQIYETLLGWAGKKLGKKYATPIFDGATEDQVFNELKLAGLTPKTNVYDGLTGQKFDQPVTVGVIYMLKLGHLVDDKMHARSIGPYSLITQQPLGGKAQFGGQRFGEMEVWALEAFGASHILQEILTVKSDDVIGRAKAYEAIVKGENLPKPNIPESFNVLVHELRGLALELTLD
mgnify:CR=1 FL=1